MYSMEIVSENVGSKVYTHSVKNSLKISGINLIHMSIGLSKIFILKCIDKN